MSNVAFVLAAIAATCLVWAIVAAMCIGAWLAGHGVRVNWIFYRAMLPWYVHRYAKMTREIDGRAGPLLPQFVVPINLALVFGVAALIAAAAAR